MKKLAVIAFLALGMVISSPGRARIVEKGEFAAGLEMESYNYHESKLMRLDGSQFGIYGSYTHFGWEPLQVELFMSYVGGDITYTGGYQSGGELKSDVGNGIFNLRPLIGWRFTEVDLFDLQGLQIMPFSGICYRYLVNHLEDLGEGGYKRQQTYWYWPLGMEALAAWPSDDRFQVGLKLEFDVLLLGKHHAGPGALVADFTQNSGWGFRFTPEMRYDLSEYLALKAELFFEYWRIGDSDSAEYQGSTYQEPENSTRKYGIRAGMIF